jgi:lysophospholipase L1-like esterase
MSSAYGLPNCVGWYQAGVGVYSDAGSTPANSGDPVYQWNDQSGAGNHLVQTTSANRPVYNAYITAETSGGAPNVAPFGDYVSTYQASYAKSIYFNGTNSYLLIPNTLTLPPSGATAVMCTRGVQRAPVSFGTDGTHTVNYLWAGGSPQQMAFYNSGLRMFPAPTYLPELTPIVHGFRASASLTETRLYMGTNQTSAINANYLNLTTTGGAVGCALNMGSGGYGNFAFMGEFYELAIFSAPLTDTMMQTLLSNMQTANRLRSDSNSNQVVFVGDSLTAGGPPPLPMSHCYPWVLCQHYGSAFKPMLVAAPGQTIAQQQARVTNEIQNLDLTPFGKNVAIVCCGSNDLGNGGTAAQAATDLGTLCTSLRSAGFKVIVITITLRTNGSGTTNAALWTAINTLNASIRANYTTYADAMVDWAADSRLSDPTNTTWFTDQLHTTDAGDGVKAALVKAALDPILTPPIATATPVLSYASFYSGGNNFAGNYGKFLKT